MAQRAAPSDLRQHPANSRPRNWDSVLLHLASQTAGAPPGVTHFQFRQYLDVHWRTCGHSFGMRPTGSRLQRLCGLTWVATAEPFVECGPGNTEVAASSRDVAGFFDIVLHSRSSGRGVKCHGYMVYEVYEKYNSPTSYTEMTKAPGWIYCGVRRWLRSNPRSPP